MKTKNYETPVVKAQAAILDLLKNWAYLLDDRCFVYKSMKSYYIGIEPYNNGYEMKINVVYPEGTYDSDQELPISICVYPESFYNERYGNNEHQITFYFSFAGKPGLSATLKPSTNGFHLQIKDVLIAWVNTEKQTAWNDITLVINEMSLHTFLTLK